MSAFLITLCLSAGPGPVVGQSTPDGQCDVVIDAELAECLKACAAGTCVPAKPAARKGGKGKKAAKQEAAAPTPAPTRDPRVDALEKDVSRLEKETSEHEDIRKEIKKVKELVIKENFETRVWSATDHVKQQEQLDDHKKRLDDHDSQLKKLHGQIKELYGLYNKYNPLGARIGLSPGLLTMKSLDGTGYTGVSLSATLTLSLRNWVEVFGEGGFIGAVSDRPLSARARGGVNVYPLSWTKVPGIQDIGLQAALSINMLEVGERLKARSAFTMVEAGPTFRFVFIDRWLALSAGMNVLVGAEFDQGHPAPAGGFAGHVAIEF